MGEEPDRDLWSDPDPDGGARESIGSYLASQRRLRGISLDELAMRTRIPRRNLERLESGAFDDQPDGFVRGFVRTVAAELGLDSQEAVMRLVGEPAAQDEEWRRRRRVGVALALAAVGLLGVLLGGWVLREAARWVASPAPGVEEELVYRRDAVRALAEAQRADPAPVPPATAPEPASESALAAGPEPASEAAPALDSEPAPDHAGASDPAAAGP